jgi:DNA-binding CsgD family transcriptional regulator/PAS domain-containing protein
MMQPARVLQAIEAIYDAAPDPSRWPDTLQRIADAFEDVGAIMVYSRDDGLFGAFSSPSLAAMVEDAHKNFAGNDLRSLRGRERGVFLERDAVTDRHVVSDEEIFTHPFYHMMARHGLRYFAGVPMSPDPRVDMAVAVQRSIDKEPYSDVELKMLTEIGRHAEKSLRLSVRLLDAERAGAGLRDAFGRLDIGVFALDTIARVVFCNDVAARMIGEGILISENRFRVAPTANRDEIEGEIENVLRGQADFAHRPRPLLVDREESTRPLVLYVLPVKRLDPIFGDFLTHTRALILAIDPQTNEPPDATVVRDVLNLTLGEARVAALVGFGLSPRDAAARLGIAEESARTTLKRVFSKVGVSRQTELSALLGRLVLR